MSLEGLRIALPYDFEFRCHVKKRWIGRSVIDVFSEEFRGRDRDYFERALECGRLAVEGRNYGEDTPLLQSESITHHIHRHEPPVPAEPIHVIYSDEDMVVVSKPACIPVHATGQYRKNTILGILEAEQPHFLPLFPIHRLDNQVSGLLIFARHRDAAQRLGKQIKEFQVCKVYLARVRGIFPRDQVVVECPLSFDHRNGIALVVPNEKSGPAKYAKTIFQRVRVAKDESFSIVSCRPITGRSHQIRIHLRETGHPIQNDLLYGGALRLQDDTGSVDRAMKLTIGDLEMQEAFNSSPNSVGEPCQREHGSLSSEETCMHCPFLLPRAYPLKLEPIWLHATSYTGDGWSFHAPSPVWAEQD